ncbi:tryptophan halogenase family protein [Pseudocolwellia sp. AS88]|uniref:tryptophan halogenase family protein n=1 Tax=Pseudocolwellia sp. AS88 TaxID=3063958 RepID=UPI0026F2AF50|nr:tryptophan halogenase family protein [Pseudocolwellia sp. AS88]MDO7084791.1 tryptophan 7-halogenase [Pseudocolwellia sp. AS88]
MTNTVKTIAIVGGGTAGWLTASIIASHHKSASNNSVNVILIESSNIPTIGVGEGTWPTLKNTLQDIGLKESDVFRKCHAAFKQGAKFTNWVHGNGDFYYHPFTVPLGYGRIDLAPYVNNIENYAIESNFQHHICEKGLAPRTFAEGEYQGTCNYAYHLDASMLGEMLKEHCINKLNVTQIVDTVKSVTLSNDGSIKSVVLNEHNEVDADLFVDCTGASSLLLGKTLGVPFKPVDDVLFNDSALAMQVPYENDDDPVATHTIATAQNTGWIWDIGLTHRRGVGHVYSSKYITDDEAENNLRTYLGKAGEGISCRKISYKPGYHERFWEKNCVAVGMSAGFVEPLEATAIMLVEISARYIAENLPASKENMLITAKRFNSQMDYRWGRIIDFLKLHYMLTKRKEPYWQAHCDPKTIPESLKEDLAIWKYKGPTISDFQGANELFPAASYQYVLYGMGFKPDFTVQQHLYQEHLQADRLIKRNEQLTEQMLQTLQPHRHFINQWLSATK